MGYVYITPGDQVRRPAPPKRKETVREFRNDEEKRTFLIGRNPELGRPENIDKLRRAVEVLPPVLVVGENVAGDSVVKGDE